MKSAFALLLLAATFTARAQQVAPDQGPSAPIPQDKTQPSPRLNPAVSDRAEHLSDQMTRDLRLNGYQSARLRAINTDKIGKLEAAERQYAKNPEQLDKQAKAISHERDAELQAVLSTDQYTDYFDARKRYAQADRDYAHNASASILVNSVQNPAPVRANNATIVPTKAKETRRAGEPFGRTLRQ
ncbi:hypothetical protein GCM10023172_32290 [Hymenobacter ginsengisoli]|uniref:Uncharacterized protein n=1 Tax=Hymenobacter ginsengisoli TaxID=1051626 RepID=A0ABP8QLF4_9BACT|nr:MULTISPECIES: hypothetical protein [unclassified Hymenobacter]MBO2031232.1 hypothetical protein [Hymenobacter sp. BT559]